MTYQMLNGLRVVESSAFIAAPLAGLALAQFGADVIRVEMIGGGIDYARMPRMDSGRSLYWTGLNKGKRSVAIDLRHPQGRELVQALATAPGPDAGVLLTNIGTPWRGRRPCWRRAGARADAAWPQDADRFTFRDGQRRRMARRNASSDEDRAGVSALSASDAAPPACRRARA